jgi:hypothetical protein
MGSVGKEPMAAAGRIRLSRGGLAPIPDHAGVGRSEDATACVGTDPWLGLVRTIPGLKNEISTPATKTCRPPAMSADPGAGARIASG